MPDIDNMDIMFYFDILEYKIRKDEKDNLKDYDNMGL